MNHSPELKQYLGLILLAVIVLLTVCYTLSAIAYHAAKGILIFSPDTRTMDYVFSSPANSSSENIHLSIEYPTKIPQSPDTGFDQLHVQAWYDTAPISQSLTELSSNPMCNPPPFVPVDSKEDDLWLLLWSPSHSITLRLDGEEADLSTFMLPINLPDTCLSSHNYTPLSISLSKSSLQSSSQEQAGDLCIAVVTSTGQPIPLQTLQALPTDNLLSIPLQDSLVAAARRFLDRLLDSSLALDCVKLPAMLSVIALGFEAWNQERKRRQEENKALDERLKALNGQKAVPPWQEVWALRERMYGEGYVPKWLLDSMDDYIIRRREAWIYEVRQWLGERFANGRSDHELPTHELLEVLVELHFLNKQQKHDLRNAREQLQSPEASHKERAEAALTILHNLGLAGLPYIEGQLKGQLAKQPKEQSNEQQRPDTKPYREMWRKDAAGRYLWVRLTGDKSIYTGEDLTQPLRGLCRLWHTELAQEITSPFGPLKAEDDPRLATHELFWDGHPAWEKAARYGHSGFLVPHGGGLSAMILQGRRTFTLYGSSTALSVYLLIDASVKVKTEEDWLKRLHRAIAESLLCALATDPVWFLAADEANGRGSTWQRELVAFLQLYSSDQDSTKQGFDGLRTLLEARFPDPMPQAGRLLLERLSTLVVDTPPPLSWPLLYNVVKGSQQRLVLYAMDNRSVPLFFWIEVQVKEAQQRHEVAQWLWNNRQLRDLGYIKLFVAIDEDEEEEAKAYDGDFTLLQWTAEQLQALLEYRLKQTGRSDERRFISDFQRWLIQQGLSPATPQAYIHAGNRWLETQ